MDLSERARRQFDQRLQQILETTRDDPNREDDDGDEDYAADQVFAELAVEGAFPGLSTSDPALFEAFVLFSLATTKCESCTTRKLVNPSPAAKTSQPRTVEQSEFLVQESMRCVALVINKTLGLCSRPV